jgi:HemK-like putative methylase
VTVGEVFDAARRRFATLHGESARIDAVRLLEAALGRDAAWLLAHDRDPLAPDVLEAFEATVRRREAGEPMAYIAGRAGFYGRTFAVSPAVLVPRPETEELAELAINWLRTLGKPEPAVCDVGTGSGILAVTIACDIPESHCTAIDISPAALEIARRNAASLGVETISSRPFRRRRATTASWRTFLMSLARRSPLRPTRRRSNRASPSTAERTASTSTAASSRLWPRTSTRAPPSS